LRRCGIGLTLALCGCSASPVAPPPSRELGAEPPYRQIVADNLKALFAEGSNMRGVSVSAPRREMTAAGPHWRLCLRGTSAGITGSSATQTYVVYINSRNEIADRRLAQPKDDCQKESYEPLAAASR
jgi:hypothetical protein